MREGQNLEELAHPLWSASDQPRKGAVDRRRPVPGVARCFKRRGARRDAERLQEIAPASPGHGHAAPASAAACAS